MVTARDQGNMQTSATATVLVQDVSDEVSLTISTHISKVYTYIQYLYDFYIYIYLSVSISRFPCSRFPSTRPRCLRMLRMCL